MSKVIFQDRDAYKVESLLLGKTASKSDDLFLCGRPACAWRPYRHPIKKKQQFTRTFIRSSAYCGNKIASKYVNLLLNLVIF